MQDPPAIAEILDLVTDRLDAAVGGEALTSYEMRVISAALRLARRAIELSPASDAAEQARLADLLGSGGLRELNVRLCERIRDGALTLASDGVAGHLRATAIEKLAIDQPTYAAYRRELSLNEEK